MTTQNLPFLDLPIDAGRPLKVVCIGAGYSGILAAIRLPQRIPNLELVIYEKNDDIGGTWYENRYPGVACDIPSHAYQFTFASNPLWSRFYAKGCEIQSYLKDVAWKYNVEKYVHLRCEFQAANWDEQTQKWQITIKNLETGEVKTDTADILLKATGLLNKWNWPNIPGLHDFRGPYMHSANWDESFDWKNKTVALIGSGSSGIQILPQIQPQAKRVFHFVRGKTWISPVGFSADEPTNVVYTEDEKRKFAEDPSLYMDYRRKIEAGLNQSQLVTFRGTEIQQHFWKICQDSMEEKLKKKPEVFDSMCPKEEYPPGCRRLTPGPGYLEACVEDNVDVVSRGIARVVENGIFDDQGQFHEVDAIIYATGFNYSFDVETTPITGRDGISLQKSWEPFPSAYLSLCVPKMPNLFLFLGPNGGPGAGSFVAMLELVVDYVIKCALKMQLEHISSMEVAEKPSQAFSEHVDKYFGTTIFSYKCKSWFKRNQDDGRIVGLWPGSSVHAQTALRNPRFEDFVYVHLRTAQDNVLCWLGNGLTMAQKEEGNTTGYLDMVDIPLVINTYSRTKLENAVFDLESFKATQLNKGNHQIDDRGENFPMMNVPVPAGDGLMSESKGEASVFHVEDVERVLVLPM